MKNALMDFTLNQKVPHKKISELEHGSREISKAEMQRGFFVGEMDKINKDEL